MKYKFFDHTADIKFQAYGKTLDEAFVNAGLATFSILINPEKVKPVIKTHVQISSKSKQSLLYDFLEELLFILDTDGFLLNKITDLKIVETKNLFVLECFIFGDGFKNYKDLHGNIKSVTYNDMVIDESVENRVFVQVVLDL